MNAKNYKNLCKNVIDFCKFAQKSIIKLFDIVLYCTHRRCSKIEPQLKVKIQDGCKTPQKPLVLNIPDNPTILITGEYKQVKAKATPQLVRDDIVTTAGAT